MVSHDNQEKLNSYWVFNSFERYLHNKNVIRCVYAICNATFVQLCGNIKADGADEAATVVHFCITPQHSRHFPTYLKEYFLMKKWSLIYRKNKRMKHTIFLLSSWVNIINKYFITIHLCFVDVNSTEIFLASLRLMQ